jgi:hypothetical protein
MPTFESRDFLFDRGVRLYGPTLFHELMSVERAGVGLALLADLIATKKLRPQIAVEAPWGKIGTVVRQLIDREFTGKAVLGIASTVEINESGQNRHFGAVPDPGPFFYRRNKRARVPEFRRISQRFLVSGARREPVFPASGTRPPKRCDPGGGQPGPSAVGNSHKNITTEIPLKSHLRGN